MADWDNDAASYSADLASRPGAEAPATLGEIWSANWNAAGLDTLTGSGAPLASAFNDLVDAASARLGPIPQAAKARGLDYFGAQGFDGKAAVIGQLASSLPKDQQAELAPLLDIRSRAADAAAKTESDAQDVAGRTYGLSGLATGWLAGMARQVVDPGNIAAMAIGGPEAGGALSALGRAALVAGAGQAVQEPVIQANRGALGLESGFGPAAEDVAEVALGATATTAAVGALFRGAAWALRNRAPAIEAPPVSANDFDAAAHLADRDQVIAPPSREQLEKIADAVELGQVTDATRTLVQGLQSVQPFTLPAFDEHAIRLTAEEAGLRDRAGELQTQLAALPPGDPAAAETLSRVSAVEDQLKTANPDERRALSQRRDELLTDTTPEQLAAAAAPLAQRRGIEAEHSAIQDRLADIAAERGVPIVQAAPALYGQSMVVPHALDAEAPAEPLSRRPIGEAPTAPAAPAEETTPPVNENSPLAPKPGQKEITPAPAEEQTKIAPIGNPQLAADAERTLAETGGDFEIELGEGQNARRVSARQALDEVNENAAAVRELEDCIGGNITAEAAE